MYWFGIKHGFGLGDFQQFERSSEPTKVKYKWITQNMKDCITWLRKAYQEEWFERVAIEEPSKWGAKTDKKETIQGGGGWLPTYKDPSVTPEFYANNVILDPWKDFYGNPNYISTSLGFWNASYGWVVTKDAEDPELAIKYLDYLYGTKEGTLIYQFGEENVDFAWKAGAYKDGSMYFFFDDKEKTQKGKDDPIYFMDEMTWVVPTSWNSKYNMKTNTKFQEIWDKWEVSMHAPVAWPILTKQEKLLYAQFVMPGGYINTQMANFITGKEPLENWDVFVAQVKKYGVEYAEKAIQMAADRMAKM